MKYIVENLIIPQDKRAEINNKILYLIDNAIISNTVDFVNFVLVYG